MADTLCGLDGALHRVFALVQRLRCERDQLLDAFRKLEQAKREARILCIGRELDDALLLVDWIEGGAP